MDSVLSRLSRRRFKYMWKPEYTETFYYINILDYRVYSTSSYNTFTLKVVEAGNCFKTKEDARRCMSDIVDILAPFQIASGCCIKTYRITGYLTHIDVSDRIRTPSRYSRVGLLFNSEKEALKILSQIGHIIEQFHYENY